MDQTQIVYAKPPADGALPDPADTFNVVHTPFDSEATNLEAGEVLVENQYLSIDPYHRFGLYDLAVTRSQFPVTKPGTVISTYGISRVLRSPNPGYAVGDLLYSWVRWERFTVVDEPNLQYLQKVKAGVDPVHYLGPLGGPGLTGYAGITRIAKPKAGETIVVMDITIQSYRSSSWEHLVPEMREEIEAPLSDGRMKFKTHVAEGLENLPAAFYGMFTGESFGKTVVKV